MQSKFFLWLLADSDAVLCLKCLKCGSKFDIEMLDIELFCFFK